MAETPWEDTLLERKLKNDLGEDLLKTMVAFANSVRPGHIATLLIGEKDDGTIQGVDNTDSIQKSIRNTAEKIYPPILWKTFVYKSDGKDCVRIEIEFDGETPHFGGPAWVRKGSVTEKASESVFQKLIDIRTAQTRELQLWVDKTVTIVGDDSTAPRALNGSLLVNHRWLGTRDGKIKFVNSFWVTFEFMDDHGFETVASEPINKITLSFDDEKNRLKILIRY